MGATYLFLSPGPIRANLREIWLKIQERWFRARLARARRSRGLRVVRGEGKPRPGGDDSDGEPWIH